MVFKELEIQGFKSFPDKVKITFDAGVTGVVGPNGSGKSNLSDAVRWVLGETSSRQLRAAGKMEDVIFGGTRRRGAMGFASVRLTLDNASHTFDVDADEVTIGRKYYRSGDSEYTINGQVCRLKDVYELLLDTGIGRDGYSVIGQGRIAEIVAAKSSERREIFEEACGIAKYRYRKTEAERRLAAAGENLERLRDILGELESRVGPLEKESAKAQKFLELSAQRKTLEVTLWTDGVHRAREAVRQQVRDYETAQTDYERFDRETKAAEQEAEEIRMQAQQLTVAVERLNGDIRSITQQISGSESRIAVLENDILRNEESAASLRQEIAADTQNQHQGEHAQNINQRAENGENQHFPIKCPVKLVAFILKLFIFSFFPAKNLDNPHPGNIFGKKSVNIRKPCPGNPVGCPGNPAENSRQDNNNGQKEKGKQGKACIQKEHNPCESRYFNNVPEKIHKNTGIHFVQRLHIICDTGNKLSHRCQIKVPGA